MRVRFILLLLVLAMVTKATNAEAPVLEAVYFGEVGCDHCDVFLYSQKQALEARYGVTLRLSNYDILKADDYALCVQMLKPFAQAFRTFPVLFIGNNAYQGNAAIDASLGAEIQYYLDHSTYRPRLQVEVHASTAASGFTARFTPVFLAGLLDGINPCAFSTLLFFLSYLTMRQTSRWVTLATGIVFIASVFAVYVMLGMGLLSGFRAIMGFRHAGLIINVVISALAVVMGMASIRDALRARAGAPDDAVMKLPDFLARSTRLLIRTTSTWSAMLMTSAITGAGVSILELACTGQIYLPTLAFINRTNRTGISVLLLLTYNTAFILPLLLLFVVFFFGTTHERIRRWYRDRIFLVRALTACFFFAMAALIWIF
ncbi:MAG TPA: cytochrome c biogenesis protein CcdA [bacterium]|nr:cytochrome c biogenesis protein CcdA [bacterium]